MKVGVTGHQHRASISWPWVAEKLRDVLREKGEPIEGYSCLAAGADQVFAEVVLELGGNIVAFVPQPNYDRHLSGGQAERYHRLLKRARVVELDSHGNDETDFFEAGKKIVDESDLLVAIWDGEPARGHGGTADIVSYALSRRVPVHHVNPITRSSERITEPE